jgi:hypothetical protein
MSDKLRLTIYRTGDAGPSVDKEPTPLNARMQWMADLVCAIMDAKTDRRPLSATAKSSSSPQADH